MKKNMFRKVFALLLALAMLIPTCMPIVGAVDGDPETPSSDEVGVLELIAPAKGVLGETVTVTAYLRQNPGIIAMQLALIYNPDVLELIETQNGNVFANSEMVLGYSYDTLPFTVQWIADSASDSSAPDITATGALVTFTFRVLPFAQLNDTDITMSFDPDNVFNGRYRNVDFSVLDAEFRIVSPRGDVNQDDSVDLKDVTVLRRYLAFWPYSIDTEQADVNYDGKVNLKDAAKLMRILVGDWDDACGACEDTGFFCPGPEEDG